MNSAFVKDLFAAGVRHVATSGGALLIAHGYLTASDLNGWIGSICFLGGLAWSAWDKYQNRKVTITVPVAPTTERTK